MFKKERATRQTFTYSMSTKETLKNKCEISLKLTIKTRGRLYTFYIANFEHISVFFFFLRSAEDLESHPVNL